jgi:intracellular multiplication protein IcmS
MNKSIPQKLKAIAQAMNVTFTLNGKPANLDEVFSESGLLPALLRRADQLCSLCMGYGIGITFEENSSALLGVTAKFDDATPNTLRYLCVLDTLCELIYTSPSRELVPLDELMYD